MIQAGRDHSQPYRRRVGFGVAARPARTRSSSADAGS